VASRSFNTWASFSLFDSAILSPPLKWSLYPARFDSEGAKSKTDVQACSFVISFE
jgi:hypothetical protein